MTRRLNLEVSLETFGAVIKLSWATLMTTSSFKKVSPELDLILVLLGITCEILGDM